MDESTAKKRSSSNEVWGKLTQILWEETALVEGLYAMMKSRLKKEHYSLIDVSGGTGFPLIGLSKKETITATYNDGSKEMQNIFIEESKGEIPAFNCDWRSMSEQVGHDTYDVALCRGNSLIYVDTWAGNFKKTEDQIILDLQKAIDNFFAILKPGGLLYLDKNSQIQEGTYRVQKTASLNGEAIQIDWLFTNNTKKRIRTWQNKVKIGAESYDFTSYGYLLTEDLLERLCYNAGFIQFEKTQIEGENTYQSYIAKKPDSSSNTFAYYNEQNKIYRKIWNENGQICWGRYEKENLSFSDAGIAHIEHLAKLAKIDENARVLDIGCGNGMTSIYLANKFGCEVVGVDPTYTNIEEANRANKNENVRFICDVVKENQFEENTFTHIWSNAAICHISKVDRIALFKTLSKIIQPKGILVFDDAFTPDRSKINAKSEIHFYRRLHYDDLFDEKEYRAMLQSSGFEVNHFEDISNHFVKSYEVLSEKAAALGYACLANDYSISAKEGKNKSVGWLLFCCKTSC